MEGTRMNGNVHATKQRSSNVELLRIVAMLMIVIYHFGVHGSWPSGKSFGADLAIDLLSFGGKISCDIFVLITGYFMVRSRFRIRGVLRLVLETVFYSWLIFAVFVVATGGAGTDDIPIDFRRVQAALLPICSGEYWFVTTFVVMMLSIPIQNLVFTWLSERGRFAVAATGFVVFSVIPTLLLANSYTSNLVWFFYLYFIGGCIRDLRDNPSLAARPPAKAAWLNPAYVAVKHPLATMLVAFAFLFGSIFVLNLLRVETGFKVVGTRWFVTQNTLPAFFAALGMFAVFSKLSIPHIPLINTCGGAVFGVYLIHDNPIVMKLLWPRFEFVYSMGAVKIVAVCLLASLSVLLVCIVVDILRARAVERPFMSALDKKFGARLDALDERLDLKKRIAGCGRPHS